VVCGKGVALVGNAQSLLTAHTDIDAHDIVVRMNRGCLIVTGRFHMVCMAIHFPTVMTFSPGQTGTMTR
jgi:hypothetical protein